MYKNSPTNDVRWLPSRDRIVDCDVRVLGLEDGSLEPLVAEIIDQLIRHSEPITLDKIASLIGVKHRNSRRIVAEILEVLRRANYISVHFGGDNGCQFAISKNPDLLRRRVREYVLDRRFLYVPRSRLC